MVVTSSQMGTTRMTMGGDGNMHMESSKMSMPQFADMLTPLVDRPVLDETGVKGNYQVALDLTMADLMRAARTAGVMAGSPRNNDRRISRWDGGDARIRAADRVHRGAATSGLKLDYRKAPVETIVVDHMEKTPTES